MPVKDLHVAAESFMGISDNDNSRDLYQLTITENMADGKVRVLIVVVFAAVL